jgi:hypothetical protein
MKDEKEIGEQRDEAWKLMIEKLGTQDAVRVLAVMRDAWKASYAPDVESSRWKGEVNYKSTLEGFPSYAFGSEIEAHFANVLFQLYTSSGKEFREDKFRAVFQMVLKLLDIDSEWKF